MTVKIPKHWKLIYEDTCDGPDCQDLDLGLRVVGFHVEVILEVDGKERLLEYDKDYRVAFKSSVIGFKLPIPSGTKATVYAVQ
jgi:hypothetical protein